MRKTGKLILICCVALAWSGFFVVRIVSHTNTPTASALSFAHLAEVRQVKEIRDYRTWTKVNPEPVNMDPAVAAMCAPPTRPQADKNPHRNKFITVYVNEAGRKAMMESARPIFPRGSVIVKEKLSSKDSTAPELLTVMIKREQGFNPASGDWEYLVVNGEGTRVEERGKLTTCQTCHVMNKSTDYIFRNYLIVSREQ